MDLANLAVIVMVGYFMDKNLNKTYDEILKEANRDWQKATRIAKEKGYAL